jgi:hypothetical protein
VHCAIKKPVPGRPVRVFSDFFRNGIVQQDVQLPHAPSSGFGRLEVMLNPSPVGVVT